MIELPSQILKVVSFDPGLNLGWAVSNSSRQILRSGCLKNDPKESMFDRQNRLYNFIEGLIIAEGPDVIVIEGVNRVHGGKTNIEKNSSTWAMYWIYGTIVHMAGKYKAAVFPIVPSQMKAAVTQGKRDPDAKGQASKDEVKKAVADLVDRKKMRSDESDAIGLNVAFWMLYHNEYIPKNAKKKKSVEKISKPEPVKKKCKRK